MLMIIGMHYNLEVAQCIPMNSGVSIMFEIAIRLSRNLVHSIMVGPCLSKWGIYGETIMKFNE